MINAAGSRNRHLDLQHHFQAASTAFHAKKLMCDKNVSVLHRLRNFEKVISPVACLVHHTVPFTKMILPNLTWKIVD